MDAVSIVNKLTGQEPLSEDLPLIKRVNLMTEIQERGLSHYIAKLHTLTEEEIVQEIHKLFGSSDIRQLGMILFLAGAWGLSSGEETQEEEAVLDNVSGDTTAVSKGRKKKAGVSK